MESKNKEVSNDEEAYFEDILEKRFGMSSNEAMKRLYYVLMLITAGTLIWVLTAVELLLVLTFDDSHKVCVSLEKSQNYIYIYDTLPGSLVVPCGSIHSRSLHQFLLLQHLRRRLGSSRQKTFYFDYMLWCGYNCIHVGTI